MEKAIKQDGPLDGAHGGITFIYHCSTRVLILCLLSRILKLLVCLGFISNCHKFIVCISWTPGMSTVSKLSKRAPESPYATLAMHTVD